jgi:hypothetical protein
VANGISRTQLVLLRGSLRSMVVFGLLFAIVKVVDTLGGGSVQWQADLDWSRDAQLPTATNADAIWQGQVLLIVRVHAALTTDDQVAADLHVGTVLGWLLVALVVRVIAEAFRIGTELRHDTEGLV